MVIVASILTMSLVALGSIVIIAVTVLNGAKDCLVAPVNLAGQAISDTQKNIGNLLTGKNSVADSYFGQFNQGIQTEQRQMAALIVKIGQSRPEKFSDRDIAIAVATAIQESNLRNLPYLNGVNDHDSLGLFQQRPSVGSWGTAAQIMDPVHATNEFYNRLAGVKNRDQKAMIDVAIEIQIPNKAAYHSRWKWDAIAQAIVSIYKTAVGGSGTPTTNMCLLAAHVPPVGSGSTHLPLDPGYHVSDGFNDPRDNMSIGSHPHVGIDLVYGSNTRGRPVYAAFSGTVIDSGMGQGCSGNNPVEVMSKDGLIAWYLHMNGSDIKVKKGDVVTAGQQIGAIGACGQVTGPHLHFAISPGNDHESWISSVQTVQKFGVTWLDPNAVMAHYGVKLLQ